MNIGFYLVWEKKPLYYLLADIMVASAKKHMPNVPVIQLTDEKSPIVNGVDDVRRIPKRPLPAMRAAHFASCEGDWLFVDTDVVFQQSVEHVFDRKYALGFDQPIGDFDIAVAARRDGPDAEYTKERGMPYNAGVIFSRSPAFWLVVSAIVNLPDTDPWYGDQKALCTVIAGDKFNVLELPSAYNFAPKDGADDASHALVVHCKGDRKDWMLDRFRKEVGLCA